MRPRTGARRRAPARVGGARRADHDRLPRALGAAGGRPGGDSAASPPARARRAGRIRRRQGGFPAETDDHHARRRGPSRRRGRTVRSTVSGVRELHLLPAGNARQGTGGCRRHRHATDHPHQEQPRQPPVRLGRSRRRAGVAPESRAVGRRPAGVRRRPPQVRPGLALHGPAAGGARLDRLHRWRRRLRVRCPGDDFVPLRRPALRQPGGGLFTRPGDRHRALRAGRPGGDHRHRRRDPDQPRARPTGRCDAAAALPGWAVDRLPRPGNRLGAQLRACHAARGRCAAGGLPGAAVRPRRPRDSALRVGCRGVRSPRAAGAGRRARRGGTGSLP